VTITKTPFSLPVGAILFPIATYVLIFKSKRLPAYLIFFGFFTVYHIVSVFVNNTFHKNPNQLYFLISDENVIACLFFIIIEHSVFDSKFLINLTKLLLVTVGISLFISVIQIKLPNFFVNPFLDADLEYTEGSRCASIYSWTNINSLGITFPFLIAILSNIFHQRKIILSFVIFAGIIVSFLSKARYVMISFVIAISQLFINTRISLAKKVTFSLVFLSLIFIGYMAANSLGYNVSDVIENRILEKDNDMGSAKARIRSVEVFMFFFPENPWFGVGPETKKEVVDMLDGTAPLIHVGYLSYLYFYGIFGFSLLAIALIFMIKYAWDIAREYNFWGAFYGIVGLLAANLTFVYFNLSEMGIILAFIYLRYFKCKSTLAKFEDVLKRKAISPIAQDYNFITTNK